MCVKMKMSKGTRKADYFLNQFLVIIKSHVLNFSENHNQTTINSTVFRK